MERPYTRSSNLKSIAGTALAGLGILVLLGNLDWAVAQWENFFCAAAGNALGILPCFVLAAWQATRAYVFDHHGLLGGLLQILLSLWTLLPAAGGAI
jgi:hypothetical protein